MIGHLGGWCGDGGGGDARVDDEALDLVGGDALDLVDGDGDANADEHDDVLDFLRALVLDSLDINVEDILS